MSSSPFLSLEDRRAAGRLRRASVSREAHAAWEPAPDRPGPVRTMQAASVGRVAALLPIKMGRMAVSPFSFFRGAAPVMAADVEPEPVTRLRMALDASGTFTSFATSFIEKSKIEASFDVSASVLEDFQVFASERGIQPSVGEWVKERPWVQSRLKQEIFNQALGVAKGDEVEAQRDPVVRAATQKLVP